MIVKLSMLSQSTTVELSGHRGQHGEGCSRFQAVNQASPSLLASDLAAIGDGVLVGSLEVSRVSELKGDSRESMSRAADKCLETSSQGITSR